MAIYNGSNKIGKVFYGTNKIGKVYYGSNLVWSDVIDLGNITFNITDSDYKLNFYSNAHAYIVNGNQLKITGKWYNMGTSVSAQVKQFATNINVGTQKAQVDFECYRYNNTQTPDTTSTGRSSAYVKTDGTLYLPVAHENWYITFNLSDRNNTLVTLNPQ